MKSAEISVCWRYLCETILSYIVCTLEPLLGNQLVSYLQVFSKYKLLRRRETWGLLEALADRWVHSNYKDKYGLQSQFTYDTILLQARNSPMQMYHQKAKTMISITILPSTCSNPDYDYYPIMPALYRIPNKKYLNLASESHAFLGFLYFYPRYLSYLKLAS